MYLILIVISISFFVGVKISNDNVKILTGMFYAYIGGIVVFIISICITPDYFIIKKEIKNEQLPIVINESNKSKIIIKFNDLKTNTIIPIESNKLFYKKSKTNKIIFIIKKYNNRSTVNLNLHKYVKTVTYEHYLSILYPTHYSVNKTRSRI